MSLTPRGRSRPVDLDILVSPDPRRRDAESTYGGPMPPDAEPDTGEPVLLHLPFRGRWQARNSPARRVPSHGTHQFGVTYAIDFVAVDDHGRSAPRSWRSVLSVEPPEIFRGFGVPVLAPVAGTVVLTHDGEADHVARRSTPAQIPYAVGQVARVRAGAPAVAGNHVVLGLGPAGPYVLLAHLRRGTVRVAPGDSRRRRRDGRGVRQLGQQHRAPRARPGHRLGGVVDGRRTPDRLPPADREPGPGCRPRRRSSMPAEVSRSGAAAARE